jgi:hypothetical protein
MTVGCVIQHVAVCALFLQVDKVVKVFRAVTQYPAPTAARIMNGGAGGNGVTVLSSWSQRNLEQGKSVNFQRMHFVDSLRKSSYMLPADTSPEYVHLHSVAVTLLRGWFAFLTPAFPVGHPSHNTYSKTEANHFTIMLQADTEKMLDNRIRGYALTHSFIAIVSGLLHVRKYLT